MRYRVGSFEIDEARFELRRDGEPVALEPKPLELLLHLLKRHPNACGREELFEALWPETIVSDSSLSTAVRALRQALGESAGQSMIRTIRGRGYSIEVDVVEQAAAASGEDAFSSSGAPRIPAASPALGGSSQPRAAAALAGSGAEPDGASFFGRAVELEQARRALASSLAGNTGILLFAGEPGIGKTRLAEELVAEAERGGARVVWGRAHEGAGQPAFWPWISLLRALASEAGDLDLIATGEGLAHELGALLPELRDKLHLREEAAPTIRPEEARYRRFEAITAFVRAQAARQPLAIVLDDLQWADESSLELLTFFAHELGAAPLLLVATYRDVELFPHPELERVLASLARAPHTSQTLLLSGLERKDIEQMVEISLSDTEREQWVDAVYERTRGNPFFARELLQLVATGDAQADGKAIPPGVHNVLRRRLAGLEPEARTVLAAASVIGRDFRLNLLADVMETPPAELLESIEPAERARIIEPVGGTSGSYRFCHPLVQETLYGDFATRERVERHARVADALERRSGSHIEPVLTRIAHHLAAAQPSVEPGRALSFAVRAADYELRLLAFEDAVRSLELAIQLIDDSGELEQERGRVLEKLAIARSRAGQPEAAAEAWWQLLAHARGLGDPQGVARAAVGISSSNVFTAHTRDDVLGVVRGALAGLADSAPALRGRLLSALARQLTWTPEWGEQIELSREAVELLRASDDRAGLIEVLGQRAALLELHGSDEDRVATYRELEALSEGGVDRETLARARTLRLQHRIEHAEGDAIDADLEDYQKLASELRHPDFRIFGARVRAMRALWRGDVPGAERLVQEALALGQKADAGHAALVFSAQFGALRRMQGRAGELEAGVREAARQHPMMATFRCGLASVLVDMQRQGEARDVFASLAANGFAALGPGDPNYWLNLALVSEVCCALGEARHASTLIRALEPRDGRYLVVPHVVTAGCASRYLGLLRALRGELPAAIDALERAVSVERRMGARAWLATALLDTARARLSRGEEGDRHAASLALAEAAGIVDDADLGGLRRAVGEVTAQLAR